jgi:hypothetical protein
MSILLLRIDASSGQAQGTPASAIQVSSVTNCANGLPRSKTGVCPEPPLCPNLCILGALASKPQSCWNHLDYESQQVNGNSCIYTFRAGYKFMGPTP